MCPHLKHLGNHTVALILIDEFKSTSIYSLMIIVYKINTSTAYNNKSKPKKNSGQNIIIDDNPFSTI